MEEILTKLLQEALPFIAIASIGFFFLLLLIRILTKIIFFLIPLFFIKKYKAYKNLRLNKKLKKPDPYYEPLDNLEFRRDLEMEKKVAMGHDLVNVVRMNEKQIESKGRSKNIVGIAKPVGKWTSMILGQKLTYLVNQASILSENEDQGFWVSMLEARERTPDMHKGRGL